MRWAVVLLSLLAAPALAQIPASHTTVGVANTGLSGTRENYTFELTVSYTYEAPSFASGTTTVSLELTSPGDAHATLDPTVLSFEVNQTDVNGGELTQLTHLNIRWDIPRAPAGFADFFVNATASPNGNLEAAQAQTRLTLPTPSHDEAAAANTAAPTLAGATADGRAALPVVLGILAFGGVAWVVAGRLATKK